MSADKFVAGFSTKLRDKAAELRRYGGSDAAQACEQIAKDLESDFQAYWLAQLTVTEAALESGYSEAHIRELAHDQKLPHTRTSGAKGHLLIERRNLPRRPHPPDPKVSPIERLLTKSPPRPRISHAS